jgi:hypothetical protein
MPVDYAVNRGDQIEVVRALPSGSPTDKIEFVRTQPRSIGEPQLASRFGQPNATTGNELARRTSTGRTLGSAQVSLSRSSSSASERRLQAATSVARRPPNTADRAAHIASGPHGPLTAAHDLHKRRRSRARCVCVVNLPAGSRPR